MSGQTFIPARTLVVEKGGVADTIVARSLVVSNNGVPCAEFGHLYSTDGATLVIDGVAADGLADYMVVDYLEVMNGPTELLLSDIVTHDHHTGELFIDNPEKVTLENPSEASFNRSVVLNTESTQYNDAGNWVGILFAIQAIGSVIWACVLPMFRSRKFSYALSLLLGAAGFISAGMLTDQYLLFVSFFLIGCAWAAMLAWPFTILTNSLKGGNIGAYLGLFNCSICIPQIIGALAGGWILSMLGQPDELAPQATMMIIAGISLVAGALCVGFIREGK